MKVAKEKTRALRDAPVSPVSSVRATGLSSSSRMGKPTDVPCKIFESLPCCHAIEAGPLQEERQDVATARIPFVLSRRIDRGEEA
jgi:hypothetical protein